MRLCRFYEHLSKFASDTSRCCSGRGRIIAQNGRDARTAFCWARTGTRCLSVSPLTKKREPHVQVECWRIKPVLQFCWTIVVHLGLRAITCHFVDLLKHLDCSLLLLYGQFLACPDLWRQRHFQRRLQRRIFQRPDLTHWTTDGVVTPTASTDCPPSLSHCLESEYFDILGATSSISQTVYTGAVDPFDGLHVAGGRWQVAGVLQYPYPLLIHIGQVHALRHG